MVQRVQDFCKTNIIVGQFGVEVITVTEPKMVVKHRLTKLPNPYLGRVKKVTTYNNVMLGCEFKAIVESRAKMTSEPTEAYDVEASRFGDWVDSKHKFCRSKGNGRDYLQIIFRRNTTPKPIWYVDDRVATEREVFDIKEYLYDTKPSHNKQHEYGVVEGNEVDVRCPKLQSIVHIKHGEKILVLK